MKLISSLEVANTKVSALHTKRNQTCKMDTSIQATKSNVRSKSIPVSCDHDTFSVLSSIEGYLRKDIDFFQTIATSIDKVEQASIKAMKGKL